MLKPNLRDSTNKADRFEADMAEIFNTFDNNVQFLFSMNLHKLQQDLSISAQIPLNCSTPTNSDRLNVSRNTQPVETREEGKLVSSLAVLCTKWKQR